MQKFLEKARKTLVYGKNSDSPDCIVLMGLPGTGKSHVSRYLHERYRYTVLSGENITHALFGDTRCEPIQYKQAYEVLYLLAHELLANGYGIVIDGTNLQYIHRKQAYDAVGLTIKTFCIHLLTDNSVALERIQKRGESSDDSTNILSSCSLGTFRSFQESFDSPREDEKVFTIISDERIFESIDNIICDLNSPARNTL